MSSSLGFFASQISGHLYTLTGSYDALYTVTVPSGGASSITFSSIPSTYKHLQIRAMAIYTGSISSADDWTLRINGDTSANYDTHNLYGNGSTPTANADTTSTYIRPTMFNRGATNGLSITIWDILDYTNVNKNKTARVLGGFDNNGSGTIGFSSGLWRNTNAIYQLDFGSAAGSLLQGSQFALYGVK